MAPAPIIFVPLVLLPAQVLWIGRDVNHVLSTEVMSHEDGYLSMADVVQPPDLPTGGASSSSAEGAVAATSSVVPATGPSVAAEVAVAAASGVVPDAGPVGPARSYLIPVHTSHYIHASCVIHTI